MDNKTIDRSLEAQLASIHEAQTKSGTVNADDVQQFIVQAKSLPNWYFLSCRGFNIPFIHEGKAYVFTNEQFAERARLHYARRAFPVEVQKHPIYNGSVFEMFVRYGAKTVSINKGASGISMKVEMFAAHEDTDGAALNRLVAEMTMKMLQGDERGYEEAADGFSRAFCAASVLYFPSPNDSDMPKMEKGYIDGAEKDVFYVFSDSVEARMFYPSLRARFVRVYTKELLTRMPGAEFVMNPASSSILIGNDIRDEIEEYRSYRRRVQEEVETMVGPTGDVHALSEAILKYNDIRSEFVAGLNGDEFELPKSNCVVVNGYTASMLMRTVAPNHVEAYAKLSKMRDALTAGEQRS